MAFPPARDRGETRPSVKPVDSYVRRRSPLHLADESIGPESSRFIMDYGEPSVIASTSTKLDRHAKEKEHADPQATVEIVDDRVHAYLGERSAPSHRVFLQVKLGAARLGFVWGCTIAAWIIAALMWYGYAELKSAALHLEPTVVLLSVVPVVLGYVLVRPGEHALERYHIKGVRLLALIAGATPIVGALTLVLTRKETRDHPPDLAVARPIWHVLVYVSLAAALLLLASLVGAATPRKLRESTLTDATLESSP
jgi:multisubunit Na+/H+ antiporter MnhB subunit